MCDARPVAGLAEAVDVDVDQLAELADEVLDVDPGAAVDVRRVLPGEQSDAHDGNVRPFTRNGWPADRSRRRRSGVAGAVRAPARGGDAAGGQGPVPSTERR